MKREQYMQSILEAIGAVTREFNARERYPSKHQSLGRPHTDIMFLLSQKQSSIKDLSARLHVTSGAVTQFIDDLESKRLVERIDNPNDGRSCLVRLTAASEKEIDHFRTEYFQSVAGHFQALSLDELATLNEMLQKIRIKQ